MRSILTTGVIGDNEDPYFQFNGNTSTRPGAARFLFCVRTVRRVLGYVLTRLTIYINNALLCHYTYYCSIINQFRILTLGRVTSTFSIRMIRCLVFSNLYPFFLRSPCQVFSVFGVYFFWYSFWEWGYQKLLSLSHIKYSKLIIRSLLCICDKTIKYYYIKSFFTDTKYMFFIILYLGFLNVYSFSSILEFKYIAYLFCITV